MKKGKGILYVSVAAAIVQAIAILAISVGFWVGLFSLFSEQPTRSVPRGYVRSEEYWDPMGYRDSTDFCIYTYDAVPFGSRERRYKPVTQDGIETVHGYFADFAGRLSGDGRMKAYPFDDACISAGDYVYIRAEEDKRESDSDSDSDSTYTHINYSVYFFDTETLTLYYIHYDN